MIHPDTELRHISQEIGYGVVATRFIPKGTITWAMDLLDRQFSPMEIEQMESIYKDIIGKYCYRNNLGRYILCWDNARYVNHSFNSNCLTTAYDFEIAIRDIQVGEELTDDYGYLNIDTPFRGINQGTKRKTVYPDDLLKYHKVWDKKLLQAVRHVHKVDQPLRVLLKEELWDHVVKVAEGSEEMVSILECFYDQKISAEEFVDSIKTENVQTQKIDNPDKKPEKK